MVKLLTSPLWQQMPLLSEPAKEVVKVEKLNTLASKLAKADMVTINEMIKSHRLNDKETDLLMELLDVNYILDVG